MDLGHDIGRTAVAAIAGAVEQAQAFGLSQHEAASAVARGALEAAQRDGARAWSGSCAAPSWTR